MTLPSVSREEVEWAWNKFGLATLLIIFGLGVFTGLVPSPLSDIQAAVETHRVDTKSMQKGIKVQNRLALESCMDQKRWHKEDPKACLEARREVTDQE